MRRKRNASQVIEIAAARAAGIESIDPLPDMGPEITLAVLKAGLAETHAKRDAYNTLLSECDEAQNEYERSEAKLKDISERILAAVGAKFGRDSDEYEMAGGRRKSERRRPSRTSVAPKPKA